MQTTRRSTYFRCGSRRGVMRWSRHGQRSAGRTTSACTRTESNWTSPSFPPSTTTPKGCGASTKFGTHMQQKPWWRFLTIVSISSSTTTMFSSLWRIYRNFKPVTTLAARRGPRSVPVETTPTVTVRRGDTFNLNSHMNESVGTYQWPKKAVKRKGKAKATDPLPAAPHAEVHIQRLINASLQRTLLDTTIKFRKTQDEGSKNIYQQMIDKILSMFWYCV